MNLPPSRAAFSPAFGRILLLLFWALGHSVAAQDTQTILNQTLLAHGGDFLAQITNSTLTGQLADVRVNGGQPVAATIKTLGRLSRLEYTDGPVAVAHIRNGTMVWESRSGQVKEYTHRDPTFLELFYNPSLGIVRTLGQAGFVYQSTTNLRGRPVYVLRRTYTVYSPQESSWPGPKEAVDLYVDTTTFLIAQVDYTYGSEYNRKSFRYDAYQRINQVAVPMTVSHWFNNNKFWELQIQSVLFNQNLDSRPFQRP